MVLSWSGRMRDAVFQFIRDTSFPSIVWVYEMNHNPKFFIVNDASSQINLKDRHKLR